jgi:hydroxypyruvate isomerase
MKRRDFVKKSAATAAGTAGLVASGGSLFAKSDQKHSARGEKFRMKYAPHLGMFSNLAGKDPIDQLNFMADEGFTAQAVS